MQDSGLNPGQHHTWEVMVLRQICYTPRPESHQKKVEEGHYLVPKWPFAPSLFHILLPNFVWRNIIICRNSTQNSFDCSLQGQSHSEHVSPEKLLFRRYQMNHRTVWNQILHCGAVSWAGGLCEDIGLLPSRSRPVGRGHECLRPSNEQTVVIR